MNLLSLIPSNRSWMICLCTWASISHAAAALNTSEWPSRQPLVVPNAGLVRATLTPQTFDAARSSLPDLRVTDPQGTEIPYLLERPTPGRRESRYIPNPEITLEGRFTRVRVPLTKPSSIRSIEIATPATTFMKAVSAEAILPGGARHSLFARQAFFRQGTAARLGMSVTNVPASARELVLTLDDTGARPIAVTGITLVEEDTPLTAVDSLTALVAGQIEGAAESRVTLDLGAARLPVTGLRFETDEPLFARRVQVISRDWVQGEVRETVLGSGVIHRLNLESTGRVEQLEIESHFEAPGRELIVLIDRGDSPALRINSVRVYFAPITLAFLAKQSGTYDLWSGHSTVAAPRYDLASMASSLGEVAGQRVVAGTLQLNSRYQAPASLPQIPTLGAAITGLNHWQFSRPLGISARGVQRLDLPLHALAHAQPSLADVRLIAGERQVLYLLDQPGAVRSVPLQFNADPIQDQPRRGRWKLELPHSGLPISKIRCQTRTTLFQRDIQVVEKRVDSRGGEFTRVLAQSHWTRTPDTGGSVLNLTLSERPQTKSVWLETDNGDNAPLELDGFEAFVPVVQLLFQVDNPGEMSLYYGNSAVAAPQYDLSLIAPQVLRASKSDAVVIGQDPESSLRGMGGVPTTWIFYGALVLVVGGLLFVLKKLIPGPQSTP